MTDPDYPRMNPRQQVAAYLAIPGQRPPMICRVAAGGDGSLPAPCARLLLDVYTNVGDVVVDLDDDAAFTAAAAAAGRRHHALGGQQLATLGHAAGYIDLMLLHWPRPEVNPRLLLLACRALLGTAGVAVVAVSVAPGKRISHLSALAGAASAAGLQLIDHITAIDPADVATPMVTLNLSATSPTNAPASTDGGQPPMPHTDLLVFRPAGRVR